VAFAATFHATLLGYPALIAPDGQRLLSKHYFDMVQPSKATADSSLVDHPDRKITTLAVGLTIVLFLSRATFESSQKTPV
jgi:hypothetical protein